jgi:hypothetical protein
MVKWFLSGVYTIAWALWLGGAVATLLFVQRLFHGDRSIAVVVAPQLFLTFEKYQLTLAAIAVIALGMSSGRKRAGLVPLILIAAVTATVSALIITPRVEHLRLVGEQASAAFRTLHGLSMLVYLIEVVLLLAAGILLARPLLPKETHESP